MSGQKSEIICKQCKRRGDSLGRFLVMLQKYTQEAWWVGSYTLSPTHFLRLRGSLKRVRSHAVLAG